MLPISVCLIAKNEEKNVVKCLAPLRRLDFEIIVIDTGSTDSTPSLASQYADKVLFFEWCQNFSTARNFSISAASNDWILVVDFDEYLEQANVESLLHFMKSYPTGIGTVTRHNPCHMLSGQQSVMTESVARFFNRKYHHYTGSIHGQICPLNDSEPLYFPLDISFYHQGYANEDTLNLKAKRNLSLLLSELEESTNDPYLLYQIGKCYQVLKDYTSACKYYDAGLSLDVNPSLTYVQDMVIAYGYCLLELKEYNAALGLANLYDVFSSHTDFVFLMGLIYMNNALLKEAIAEFKKATSMPPGTLEGINSYVSNYNIGVIHECAGHIPEAIVYYRKCNQYAPAQKRLALLSENTP